MNVSIDKSDIFEGNDLVKSKIKNYYDLNLDDEYIPNKKGVFIVDDDYLSMKDLSKNKSSLNPKQLIENDAENLQKLADNEVACVIADIIRNDIKNNVDISSTIAKIIPFKKDFKRFMDSYPNLLGYINRPTELMKVLNPTK